MKSTKHLTWERLPNGKYVGRNDPVVFYVYKGRVHHVWYVERRNGSRETTSSLTDAKGLADFRAKQANYPPQVTP